MIQPLSSDPRPGTRPLADTALGAVGIELLVVEVGRVVARMPIGDSRWERARPLVLAETVASTAAGFAAGARRRAFGAELNASWVVGAEPIPAGVVRAEATPLALGHDQHVWRVEVTGDDGSRILECRCTLGIVDAPPAN